MDSTEKKRCLTCTIGCIVGLGICVYHVLAAKYLHQLLKELALLFLPPANIILKLSISNRPSVTLPKLYSTIGCVTSGATYFLPSRNCRKLAFSLLILFWHCSGVRR